MPVIAILLCRSASLTAQKTKPLPATPSPGTSIARAAKESNHDRPGSDSVDVLSDTQGVDFKPYLRKVTVTVREHWYNLIREEAKNIRGEVAIEFEIQKDGRLGDMRQVASSGSILLDRPAWGAVTGSSPFAALPPEFKGDHLVLRFRFQYNPDKAGLFDSDAPAVDHVIHAKLLRPLGESDLPKYPENSLAAEIDGVVRLEVAVKKDGKVGEVKVLEGDSTLADAATAAIRHWRFRPAQQDEMPADDIVLIKVEFRLAGEKVRAEVVSTGLVVPEKSRQ